MIEQKIVTGRNVGFFNKSDRLNATNAQQVKEKLNEILSHEGAELTLNMSNIRFVDSTGLGVLISALKTARQNNCTFQLCCIQKDVMSLITLMKLDKVFDIIHDEETQFKSF